MGQHTCGVPQPYSKRYKILFILFALERLQIGQKIEVFKIGKS